MKNKNNNLKIVVYFLVVFLFLLNLYILFLNYTSMNNLGKNSYEKELNYTLPDFNISDTPLSLQGFTLINVNLSENKIILYSKCYKLALETNDVQFYSIKEGLTNSIDVRPTIHDTTLAIFDHFNVSLIMVKIVDKKDELYFSNIYLKNGNNILSIDAKPSDSIALAIRKNIPIYINDGLLNKNADNTCESSK